MNCFNKQNKIYFKPTSTRSIAKSNPGSVHIDTFIHQVLHGIVIYDFLLYRCHRYKVFLKCVLSYTYIHTKAFSRPQTLYTLFTR